MAAKNLQLTEQDMDQMDAFAEEVGAEGWELGPDIYNPAKIGCGLSIGCDLSLLNVIQGEVQQLSQVDGWEFYAGLPPRDWDLYIDFVDEDDCRTGVEGRQLKYTVAERSEGWKVVVYAEMQNGMGQSFWDYCAENIVIGEIGEENFERYIVEFEVGELANCPQGLAVSKFGDFAKNFASAFPECAFREILIRKQNGTVDRALSS